MAAKKRAGKGSSAASKAKKKAAAPAKKKASPKAPAQKTPARKTAAAKTSKGPAKKKASAKALARPEAGAKRPKLPPPAKANPPPAVPYKKTIDMTNKPPPPKPKPTISRAKAVALAETFFKENVGRGELYAPRASRFRLGSVIDRGGVINICFCHEADDHDPVIESLGAKCKDALLAAHPQLKAFEVEVQTIRM